MVVQDIFCLIEGGAYRHRDEVLTRHYFRNGLVYIALKTEVSISKDTDQPTFVPTIFSDRYA